jgi:hypothetical protein
MSYSEESERNSYNSWEDKKFGETYREAESRTEKSDAFQRNLERQMDANYQNERNRHNRSSGSYSGDSYASRKEITSLAKWIGRFGIVLFLVSCVVLYYEIQLPAMMGDPILQISFQISIALIVIGFFPKLLVGFLGIAAISVAFLNSRTPEGLQLSAIPTQSWILIVSLFIASFIAKRLLIRN